MSTIFHRNAAPTWWGRELPKHIIYLYKNHAYDDWKEYTKQDQIADKVKKMNSNIWSKRWVENHSMPCFIWVFFNNSWIFGGWYIYIKTSKKSYPLNFKTEQTKLIEKIMEIVPLGYLPLIENFEGWAKEFMKRFNRSAFGKRKSALLKARCVVDNWEVIDVKIENPR